ncbi:MAG: hypothetical protein J5715_05210 [Clostridiales bacterium]|nr:hypothetical protein [Clostridiales bacterium]
MKRKQIVNTAVAGALIASFALMSIASSSSSSRDTSPDETQETEASSVEDSVEPDGSENSGTIATDESFTDTMAENAKAMKDGKYLFITPADLQKFCYNLSGVKIYTVGEISDFSDDAVQMSLGEGFMMSSFHTKTDYSNTLNKGDTVAIFGEVNKQTDYIIFGTSVDIIDCNVFAVGKDADEYNKEKSDKGLSEYLVVTEAVANATEVTEKEYKSICKTYKYKKILRDPDKYKGKYTVVSGKISQIIEGWFGSYTIYVVDKNNNKWECSYTYAEGESHFLEGDKVKVYGTCNGTSTSTTLLGKQVSMPDISAKYIDKKKK